MQLVQLDGAGEAPPSVSLLPHVNRVLGYVAVLLLVAWVAFSFSAQDWSGSQRVVEEPLAESLEAYEAAHLRWALQTRFLRDGSFPTRLLDLAVDGWIDGRHHA